MKKTILSVLLVLVLMLSFVAVSVSATEGTQTTHEAHPHDDANYAHCICGGSAVNVGNHTCDESIVWTPISEALTAKGLTMQKANFGTLDSGYYYLDGNVKVTAASTIGTLTQNTTTKLYELTAKRDIYLCLNGYEVTTNQARVFGNTCQQSTLNICDCSGVEGADGVWTWNGSIIGGNSPYGAILYTYGESKVNIYGGNFTNIYTENVLVSQSNTVDGVTTTKDCNDDEALKGGLFVIAQDRASTGSSTDASVGAIFNLYNGCIFGGQAGDGGNIYLMHACTMNMYGGVIKDGKTVTVLRLANKKFQSGGLYGGNISSDVNATVNVMGGLITNGNAKYGGNLYTRKMNVSNGTISNGTSTSSGGNIYISSGGNSTISGGTITNGTSSLGGNISVYANAQKATLKMTAGTVSYGTSLGGGGANIHLSTHADTSEDAVVTIEGGQVLGGTVKDGSNGGSIRSNDADSILVIGVKGSSAGPMISGGTVTNAYGGNIHATGKMTIYSGTIEKGSAIRGGNINTSATLDIRGGTIKDGVAKDGEGGGNIYASSTFNLSGGTIKDGTSSKYGGNIYAKKLNMTGGTITNGTAADYAGNIFLVSGCVSEISGGTISEGNTPKNGGNIAMSGYSANSTLTISGGTISNTKTNKAGGNIMVYSRPGTDYSAVLTITGGTITGGHCTGSTSGGSIRLDDVNCSLVLGTEGQTGGAVITGGTAPAAYGGNIYSKGNVTIHGGTISDGDAQYGGNLYVVSGASLTITGGELSGGNASDGGNLYTEPGMTMTGGLITKGTATSGGNIRITGGTSTISGGVISCGYAANDGGNLRINGNCPVYISGNAIIDGQDADGNYPEAGVNAKTGSIHAYGNVYLSENAIIRNGKAKESGGNLYIRNTFEMTGGSVMNGEAPKGGNYYAYVDNSSPVLKLSGGLISGGKATGDFGGNICIETKEGSTKTATIAVSNITIEGGTAIKYGGNVYSDQGWNMTGGIIRDGMAEDGPTTKISTNGGNLYIIGGGTISGASITGGKASHGGNMYLNGGTFALTDCIISDGLANLDCNETGNGNGGNVLSAATSTTTISGCTITGGVARLAGGVGAWGKVTITDTTISGGQATAGGGCVATYGSGQLTLGAGVLVKEGEAPKGGAVHYASNAGKEQVIADGAVLQAGEGSSYAPCVSAAGGKLILTGAPSIDHIWFDLAASAYSADVSGLTVTQPIEITASKAGELAVAETDRRSCFANNEGYIMSYRDGKLYLDAPAAVYVSDNGDDTNNGAQNTPYKTLNRAFAMVADKGTVYIVDTLTQKTYTTGEGGWAAHKKSVTLSGGTFVLPEERIYSRDNVTYDGVTIIMPLSTKNTTSNYGSYYFYCDGFTTVFEDDVTTLYRFNGQESTDSYHSVKYMDGTTEKSTTASAKLYGGANSTYGTIKSTNLTVLGGVWGEIYGGSNQQEITGDVHLTVGGNVNKGVDYSAIGHSDATADRYIICGGSRNGKISGTVYMNVTGGTHVSTHGGSYGKVSAKAVEMYITGGEGMAIYGAGRGGANTVGTVNMYYQGGTFEQVFGGALSNKLTGDVNMYVTGGNITRRLYGGCYSGVSNTGEWTSDNFVTGNICLYIGSGANIPCDLKDPDPGIAGLVTGGKYSDRGIYGHSRRGTHSDTDAETSAIIFLDEAAYNKHKDNLTAQDSIMAGFMNGISAADVICYLQPWMVDEAGAQIVRPAIAVQDPETKKTGDASAFVEFAKIETQKAYTYKGQAVNATVSTSEGWKYGDVVAQYTNNQAPGTATATITVTINGQDYTLSAQYQIKDGALVKVGDKTYYTLAEAIADTAENGYLKLLGNTSEDLTIPVTMYLDLNGYSVLGTVTVAEGQTLYGMDATTNDYDCSDGYGTIANVVGNVALHHQTTAGGAIRRYLTYTDPDTGAASFHRIYLGIIKTTLRPGVVGVGYKAIFGADQVAQSMLDTQEAFGYGLWLGDSQTKHAQFLGAGSFTTGKEISLLLQNFDVENYGDMTVNAEVYLKLNGNYTDAEGAQIVIDSADYSYTMKQMLLNVDADLEGFTPVQLKALKAMCEKFREVLTGWGVSNIFNWAAETETV